MSVPRSSVLVPLYVYPLTPETWKPLYDAIQSYPNTSFTVVLNPNSGPGKDPTPDESYIREIARLNSFPNVTTIGYVRIDYCKRDIQKVKRDISFYSGWAALNPEGKEQEEGLGDLYRSISEITTGRIVEGGASQKTGQKTGFLKPAVKSKPWHLKSLFRTKSPSKNLNDEINSDDALPSSTVKTSTTNSSTPHSATPYLPATANSPANRLPKSNSEISPSSATKSIDDPSLLPENKLNSKSTATVTENGKRPLAVHGIFFDETPNLYSSSKLQYLAQINLCVKSTKGIGGSKFILHNPGTMPDPELVGLEGSSERRDALLEMERGQVGQLSTASLLEEYIPPDVTAIFEASYAEYISPSPWTVSQQAKCQVQRKRAAMLVHSVPKEHVVEVTRQLCAEAEHVFVTDLTKGFYCSFDTSWDLFVKTLAAM